MPDNPGVIAPPPLIFLAVLVLGALGRRFVPYYQSFALAAGVGAIGALLLAWAISQMVRAGTHIEPYKPSTKVVTTGPYRFTRNPIYLSLNLLYAALAIALGLMSALILLPIANLFLHFGVVKREERYLEAKFGEEYRSYQSRVRRWL